LCVQALVDAELVDRHGAAYSDALPVELAVELVGGVLRRIEYLYSEAVFLKSCFKLFQVHDHTSGCFFLKDNISRAQNKAANTL
jgi:hypothetical protein